MNARTPPHALIVGGGIGGLTTARALLTAGARVTLVEQADAWEPVGAGISLAANALAVLDRLGMGDAVRAVGRELPEALIGDRRGRTLQRVALARHHVLALHRAELHDALRTGAAGADIRLGTTVTAVRERASGVSVELSDATPLDVDLLVGADGLRSWVREHCWPDGPGLRETGISVWRVTVEDPVGVEQQIEQWGHGLVAGLVPLTRERVYGYFAVPDAGAAADDPLPRERFSAFGGPVRAFLDALPASAPTLRHDLAELDGVVCGGGRVALVGDAAHAMLPYLGQGAAQAVEDAMALADAVSRHVDLAAAVASYRAAREPRTRAVQRRSRAAGSVAHVRPGPLAALRDGALRIVPRASSRSLAALLRPGLELAERDRTPLS